MHSITTTQLYSEYSTTILRFLRKYTTESDSEDLLQSIFLKIAENLGGFKGESSLKTWIFRIAVNSLKDLFKSKHHQVSATTVSLDTLQVSTPSPGNGCSIEDSIDSNEMKKCIHEFIHRLPFNHSSILVLHEIEGFTIKDIAAIMNTSEGAMKVRLLRSRAKLRKLLNSACTLSFDCSDKMLCERK